MAENFQWISYHMHEIIEMHMAIDAHFFPSNCTRRAFSGAIKIGRICWSSSLFHVSRAPSPFSVNLKSNEIAKVEVLKQKVKHVGIDFPDSLTLGLYNNIFCPKCRGRQSMERSLSFHVGLDGGFAMWRCFRSCCGWAGQAYADAPEISKVNPNGHMIVGDLELEPLGMKLITYFATRMISEGTLRRNAIMQVSCEQPVIAFPYKQNEVLVGCKFRTIEKRFWQAKGTQRWFYGLDDIDEASEIIIVEGEVDKLSLEEAGFRNCVSVPAGAPNKLSTESMPDSEKDTAFQYLWNCKEYFDKVPRIILATDSDPPGQALAKGLAHRLGKERCWHVHWPRKDELQYCKDANEVLQSLGANELRKSIESAELYES